MSMISEQIKELRELADCYYGEIRHHVSTILQAADTIETLSAKLADMERTAEDCSGGWIYCGDGKNLPEESLNSVIGWDEYRKRSCFVQYWGGRWILGNDVDSVNIIAWQPSPEEYKEGI